MTGAKTIPRMVVKRLTAYYAAVRRFRADGVEWVSSRALAEALGLTSSTVRQDLSHLDFSGISKRGYASDGLENVLAKVLGADKDWNVAVAGAGNLGRALAQHEEFRRQGFRIRAVLDTDREKIGRKIGALTVAHADDLSSIARRIGIDIGVIAVPSSAAQDAADAFVAAGVKGIINMSMTRVTAGDVPVVDTRIVESLQELSCAIRLRSGAADNRSHAP